MNLHSQAKLAVTAAILLPVALSVLLIGDRLFTAPQLAGAAEAESAKKADNSKCYVCHPSLKVEEIAAAHLAAGHGCVKCHGASTEHLQDEMQMTTPDILYGRKQVDAMCGECHEDPHEEVQAELKSFLAQWRGHSGPNGRTIYETSICTDCHGTHNINKETDTRFGKKLPVWESAFNGRDLAGWKSSGPAEWKVKLGRIVGTADAQTDGSLWTEARYGDYRAAITFRADFPIHAGIWLRSDDSDRGPRVEIFEHDKPAAFTGSLGLGGKQLVMLNLRKDLFDAGGWNTLAVEVRGSRAAVWLNGAEIGAACCPMPEQGRVGLYLSGGPAYRQSQLAVREFQIQRLAGDQHEKE